jgi:hypothetical protein
MKSEKLNIRLMHLLFRLVWKQREALPPVLFNFASECAIRTAQENQDGLEQCDTSAPGLYLLTPWCRISFEKLIVTQVVKKYPAFLRNPKVHHRVHKSPPPDPILSQPNSVRPIDPYLSKVHLNVILPPTPRSSQWSLAFGQLLVCTDDKLPNERKERDVSKRVDLK